MSGESENVPVNENTARQQRQLKLGLIITAMVIFGFYLLTQLGGPKKTVNDKTSEDLTTSVQRRPGDQENFATMSKQVNDVLKEQRETRQTLERFNTFLDDQDKLDPSDLSEAQAQASAALQEVEALRSLVERLQNSKNSIISGDPFAAQLPPPSQNGASGASGAISARPSNMGDIFSPKGRVRRGADQSLEGSFKGSAPSASASPPVTRTQRVIKLFGDSTAEKGSAAKDKEAALKGDQTKAKAPEVYDTRNFVPPNAYVNARLVVSVDAPIGESSQANPKAAQFIVTGAAHHVQTGRKIETTELEGCLINGSAQGELSSERVHIKLHVMTCPLPGGRVSVSKVEGYATHLGKNGIRGAVVSREGDLVTKAIMAGFLGGIGQASTQFGQSSLGNGSGGLIGDRPSAEDIGISALGGGVAGGANAWQDYLLDRAKAYEPVVSLPTGIEVELVFQSGTLVRPLEDGED